MAGNLICKFCNERFSDSKKAREHSDKPGHQVRPLEPDEYDQPAVSKQPECYSSETTTQFEKAILETAKRQTHYLTSEIARATTDAGGRIPIKFDGSVTKHSRNQTCEWTVYAPSPNPYHVAAAVVDVVEDSENIESFQVHVSEKTAAEITETVRGNRMYFEFETDEYDKLERCLRILRWSGGTEKDDLHGWVEEKISTQESAERLADSPGDAWDHHTITVSVREERERL